MPPNYKPSGNVRPIFAATAVAVAGLAVGAGWVYQWLIGLIPLVILTFVLTAAYAYGLWYAMDRAVQFGHARSPWVGAAAGVAAAVIGLAASYYFQYLGAVEMVVQEQNVGAEMADVVKQKFTFWDWVGVRVEQGYEITRRGSNGLPLTGPFVYLIWFLEAAVLVGAAGLGGWNASSRPYCESCGEWCEGGLLQLYPKPVETAVTQIETASDLDDLLEVDVELGRRDDRALAYLVEECPSCDETKYLTVTLQTITVDSDGDEEIEEEHLWYELEVDPQTPQRVAELGERINAAIEAETPDGGRSPEATEEHQAG